MTPLPQPNPFVWRREGSEAWQSAAAIQNTQYLIRGISPHDRESRTFNDFPLSKISAEDIEVLRDRKIHTPEAANGRVKAARQVCKFAAKKQKYLKNNIARDVEYFLTGSTGFHTWTVEEVEQFQERHPIGTKARLALALLCFTGQRRSDIIRFGKQHVRNGLLTFTQHKGRNKKPKRLILPVLPMLREIIDASPRGELTFLINDLGRAFTDAGFGNKMRDWCNQANLPHCSAHGGRRRRDDFQDWSKCSHPGKQAGSVKVDHF